MRRSHIFCRCAKEIPYRALLQIITSYRVLLQKSSRMQTPFLSAIRTGHSVLDCSCANVISFYMCKRAKEPCKRWTSAKQHCKSSFWHTAKNDDVCTSPKEMTFACNVVDYAHREVGGWGRDPKKCTGRDWGMGSSTI